MSDVRHRSRGWEVEGWRWPGQAAASGAQSKKKNAWIREDIRGKNRLSFGHCPKVVSIPPLILDILEVTFLSVTFGQP